MKRKLKIKHLLSVFIILALGIVIGLTISPNNQITGDSTKIILVEDQKQAQIVLVAVDDNDNGVYSKLTTTIKPGTGQILVDINDIVADPTTQISARTAAQVAARYTKTDLSKIDVIYSIDSPATLVAGPSAGAAMTISTISALQDKKLRDDVVITGTINEDGTIGEAGAIKEKAQAAKESGATLFLIPKGSAPGLVSYGTKKSCKNIEDIHYCKIIYEEKKSNLDLGIEIKEISSIDEALPYFYNEN